MNERIKELSEQADLYARSDNSSMLFEIYQKRYTEKFAELIVKECIEIVENSQADVDFAIWKLKKDFGVNDEL